MAQNSNNNNSGFKYSPWMGIALVIAIFITINLFSSGFDLSNPGKTSLSKFNEFLNAGQVEKVTFTNTKATVFLKKEALKDKKHDKVKNDITGKLNTKGPHYHFEIGDLRTFQESLVKADAEKKINSYEKEPESMWESYFPFFYLLQF